MLPESRLVGLATVGAEFSVVFNNAMLPGLTTPEKMGRLSGYAWALGYVAGSVVEADPTGGSGLLAGYFRGTREYDAGLIELALTASNLSDALADVARPIEGTTVSTKYGPVSTDHVLFIASGAFHVAKPSDLLPELQGRLPIRVELKALTEADFVRIMTEPENALPKQYAALCAAEGAEIMRLLFGPAFREAGGLKANDEVRVAGVESGKPYEAMCRIRRASDRTYRWFVTRATPLRNRPEAGIWEGFVPGVGTGERYKFSVLSQDGWSRFEKSDTVITRAARRIDCSCASVISNAASVSSAECATRSCSPGV